MSFRLEDKIKLHISDKVKLKNLIHDQKVVSFIQTGLSLVFILITNT